MTVNQKKSSAHSGNALSRVIRLSGKRTLRWTLRPQRRISALLWALLATCIPAFTPVARALDLNALPSNGAVRVGGGTITQSGNQLTVNQSTTKIGIDWQSFNIGAKATVNFVQPSVSAVALNRVIGNDASQIFGRLTSNGQVFLTNPNGVLFAPGAKVDVGGLVASSLDLTQENFAAGKYRFSGSGGSVTNQGSLNAAAGGYIGLFGGNVSNRGQIDAPTGSVVLASGSAVTVGIDPGGLFSAVVTPATAASMVSNSGSITADAGSVRLDAQTAQGIAESLINNSGVIRASSIENRNGEIWLTGATQVTNTGTLDVSAQTTGKGGNIVVKADMQSGTAQVGGTLLAQGGTQGGDGGFIETSGAQVHFAPDVAISTAAPKGITGQWLIDPADFVVSASGDITGTGLASKLLSNNITIDSDNGTVVTNGNGDITVNEAVSWSGSNSLTLNALRNINVNANLSNSSGAQLILRSDKNGTGTGTVIFGTGAGVAMGTTGRVDLYYNPTNYTAAGSTNFTSNLAGSTNAVAWMLVNDVGIAAGTGKGLQGMANNLAGNYALGKDIDASGTSTWNTNAGFNPVGNNSTPFIGKFDGLGHTISGLTINRTGSAYVGLFGYVSNGSSVIQNVTLAGGSVSALYYVGSLVGQLNSGSVVNASSSASVTGTYYYIGGLVGINGGTISTSHTSGMVANTANGYYYIGGLVGQNTGSITNSYSSAAVSGPLNGYASNIGGLVGYQPSGTVSGSYATGTVNGGASGSNVGGLIGYVGGGTVSNSYASNAVTGGGGNVGSVFGISYATLNNVTFNIDQSRVNGASVYAPYVYGSNTVVGLDSAQVQEKFLHAGVLDIANYASGLSFVSTVGGYSTYNINSAQGLKDMLGFVGNASYKFALSGDVDLSAVPGYYIPSFTANSFNGNGFTISNLNIPQAGASNVGFIGTLGANSTLSNLVLSNVSVNGVSYIGGAVGQALAPAASRDTITGVSVSGAVTGTGSYVGGLVGSTEYLAGVSNSSSSANVQGANYLGGLIGITYYGNISSVSATGNVTAGNSVSYIGGLVGYNRYAAITGTTISPVFASGAVIAGTSTSNVGGLIGNNYAATVTDAYATGTVTVGANSSVVGGLMGSSYSSTLARLYATGNVTTGDTSSYIGGLVGSLSYGSITTVRATGSVTTGTSSYVGGLIGDVYTSISQAYATGAVTGGSSVGPLFGRYQGYSTTNVIYDIDSSTVNGQRVYGPGGYAHTQFLEVQSTGTLNIANYTSTLPFDSISGSYVITNQQGLKDMLGFATVTSYKFSLGTDLDLASMPGYNVPSFTASSFNGNNHALSNLTLSPTANPWATSSLGLFSVLGSNSTINNLTLTNASVSAASGANYVGALVGQALAPASARAMISNVNVSGSVSVTNGYYIGGVVGQMAGAGGMDGVTSSASVSGYYVVGGLAGITNTGTVNNSSASGAVSVSSSGSYLGGLVGYTGGGAITSSHASGAVTAGASASNIGGLVGYNYADISNSYATGAVSGGISASYLGGLMGSNSGSINNSYATGTVTVALNASNVQTGNYVGGLVGNNASSVSNSYSSGGVAGATNTAVLFGYNTSTGISNVFYNIDTSTVNGNSYVGPYGIYTAQFQDWINSGKTLAIAHYGSLSLNNGFYEISSLQGMKDLLGFAGVSSYKFKLTANVDLTSVPGYYIPVFTAQAFDGSGNTLSNLAINQPTVSNIGFIGTLGAASTLSNLTLSNIAVTGAGYVGGAVGQALSPASATAMLSNVNVTGASSVSATYTSSISNSGNYVGGLVGQILGAGGVSGSSSTATVQGIHNVGGLVGNTNSGGIISNSHASGIVTGGNAAYYVGGLVGYAYLTTINNSYATGNVVTTTGGPAELGGLIGYQYYGSIANSYATGAVSAGANAYYLGGLVGLGYGSINGSYATGSVTSGTSVNGAGGLVGNNGGGAISGSYATGAVNVDANATYLGGLVGYNSGTLTNSYATGVVTSRDSTNANNATNVSGSYVGGLAGYNTADVSSSYSSGAVTGATNTAVLFGYNSATKITNVFYNIDTSTVNGSSYVGPYGIYTEQFQDWIGNSLTLDITASKYANSTNGTLQLVNGFYQIGDLQGMKDLLGFAGIAGYKFKLTTNVDLFSVPGYYIPVFNAQSFDGGGKTLSNLAINQPTVSNIGFIGTLGAGSTLSNLNLDHISVTGLSYVGGAVGQAMNPSTARAVISNVSVTGVGGASSVVAAYDSAISNSGNYVGGLVGYLYGQAGLDTVSSTATVRGSNYVGGLLGVNNSGAITNAFATGSVGAGVTGTLPTYTSWNYIGGLIGTNGSGTISASYATGAVSAATAGTSYIYSNSVGGLIGYNNGSISDAHASGSVTVGNGAGGSINNIGGLVGQNNYYGTLDNIYATGSVTTANGNSVGGLIGGASSSTVSRSYATGNVTGYQNIGGLVGYSNSASIATSFATGAATGTYYVGGLVGQSNYGTITNAYARGSVATSTSYVGGLVGYYYYTTISNSFSTGATGTGSNRGGLIGYNAGGVSYVSNSYWDTTTSGIATSVGGTGLATAAMKTQASFTGLDFSTIWKIYEGNTYPMLQAFLKPVTITAGSDSKVYDQQAYSSSLNTVVYSDVTAIGQLQGSLLVTDTAQGAVNAGTYAVTPSGLWSNSQFGYNITYVAGALTITPLSVSVSGITVADKVYDGTTVATVRGGSFGGSILSGDLVNVVGMLGSFADKNVANGIAVTIPIGASLGGPQGMNYVVTNTSTATANITPKTLSVGSVTAASKVYDGTTDVVLSGAGSLSGIVLGDTVSLSGLTGAFLDKNVGTGKSVTVAGGVLSGAQASNYQLTGSLNSVATADITPLAITSSGITALNKVYDRTTSASINTTSGQLNGVVQGDVVGLDFSIATGIFADKNAGTSKAVTISGLALSGTDAINYTFTDSSAATAAIAPKQVTLTGAVASNRAYNGTNTASISGAVANGVISGDSTNTGSITGFFDTKNIGNGKTVTLAANTRLGGTDGANYVVSSYNPLSANITAYTLSVTSVTVSNKVYDGTTLASVSGGLLTGVVGTDNVTLSQVTGTFASKAVGNAKTVTFSGGVLSGADAANYQLAGLVSGTTTANITARPLVVSGISALDKVYDRTTAAVLNTSGWSVIGLVTGDDISVNINSVTGAFANKNVGVAKTVTISGLGLTGADSTNYSVSYPSSSQATITAAPVTLTGYSAANKTYDGNRNAVVTGGAASGVLSGDSVITASLTGLFDSKAAGTSKPVTLVGASLGGTDGGNYVVISANAMTADITPKLLTTSALTALNKVYDGTLLATLSGGTLSGVVGGDNVSLTALSGLFTDKNVGTGKTVNISGGALTGTDANNYVLSSTFSGTATASITSRVLNTTGITAQDKVYDRLNSATISTSSALVGGIISGDSVTVDLSGAIGSFADKNVGTSKAVTISGILLAGTDASNYSILDASNPTASITPVGVTLSGYTAASRVYDGTRIATVTGGSALGLLGGDAVVTSTLSGLFDTKNVGTGKAVTLVGSALGGADGGNYLVISANALSANITPKTLTASAITVSNKVYDGTATASFSGGVLSGKVGSDNVDLTAVTATFADKSAGSGKTVTISGGGLTGVDASNYQLTSSLSGTTTANITRLGITTIGITAQDKVYDQSASATLDTTSASLRGVLAGDATTVALDLSSVAGSFANKNVGVARAVTISGLALSGTDALNYTVSDASNALASITPVSVTLSGYSAVSKVYDGTRIAVVSGGTATGVLGGDSVNASVLSGLFDTKNVGTGKSVTIVGSTLGTGDGANYIVASANLLNANITPKNLTVSTVAVANKVYDGTVAASFSGGLLSGVVSGDSVSLSSITASFSDKNVGYSKTVNISGGALSGSDLANYQLVGSVPATSVANITPLAITSTGITAQGKVYDRNTTAGISTSGAALQGAIAGDTITLLTTNALGSFADKNTGVAKAVTVTGLQLGGTDAGNYSLTDASHATATITALGVSITGASAANKVYDGNRNAAISGAIVSGVLSGDVVSLTGLLGLFDNKNVGTGKTVSLGGVGLGGADGANYVITSANALTANITPRTLTASAVTALSKVYDGTAVANLNGGVLSGSISGDVVSLSSLVGNYNDKSVGAAKTVTITAGGLTGTDAGNYTLSNSVSGTTTASITARTLTTSGITAQNKVYDQSTLAIISTSAIALNNVVTGDTVLLDATGAVGNFANKNVGVGKAVSVNGLVLSGADAGNYVVSTATGATASITPKQVSLSSYAAIDKVYDGTTVATLIGGTATGLIAGDLVSSSVLSGQFANKNVGANKTVTVSGITLSGADGGNYVVSGATSVTASIFARTLTLSSLQAASKVYDGTTTAAISGILSNVVSGDNVILSNLSGVFANKNVGTGKTVTISGGNLNGSDAGNYQLAGSVSGTATAAITPLTLTLSGITASDKVYDRTTTASLNVTNALLQGVLGLDSVNLNLGAATGSFADKNAGTNKTVTVGGLVLSGTDAGNYLLSNLSNTTASILARAVTVTGAVGQDKVYDGTTNAVVNLGSVSGVLAGDVVNLTSLAGQFASKTVGSNKAITLTSAGLNGTDGANYTITSTIAASASITPKIISLAGATASDKVYDGTATATLIGGALNGLLSGDVVSLTGQTGAFSDKNAGISKTVTFSGGSLAGGDAANYQLTGTLSGTVTASITPKPLIISGITAADKTYDQTTAVALSISSIVPLGVIGSDIVTLNVGTVTGQFADKNAGTNKGVLLSGLTLTGGDAGNYSVNSTNSVTATISALSVTITGATAQSKIYDGSANAVVVGGGVSGVLSGDVVSLSALNGQFADKNVGVNKTVTLANATLGGTDGANYRITGSNPLSSNILARPITLVSATVSNKVYDGTAQATVSGIALSNVVSGETVNVSGLVAQFQDVNAGTNKLITFTGGTLSGSDAANYSLGVPVTLANAPSITPSPIIVSGKTIVVSADQLATVTPVWTITGLAGADTFSGVTMASVVDTTASAGSLLAFTPTGGALTSGLAANYVLPSTPYATGYVVVLPTQASALAGDTGSNNTFFVQLDANETANALRALSGTTAANKAVLSGSNGLFGQAGALSSSGGGETAANGESDAQSDAQDFQREVKESTPQLIKKLRDKPLLNWDRQPPGKPINVSDSGVTN